MKTRITLRALAFIVGLFSSCGTSKSGNNQTDSLSAFVRPGDSTTRGDDTQISEQDESPSGESETPTESFTLKWKAISYMEYGPTYEFEDQSGKAVYFFHLDIPGFSDEDNPYYSATHSDDRIFPEITINDGIQDKWFTVTVIKRIVEAEGAGEMQEVDVIIGIEPIQ